MSRMTITVDTREQRAYDFQRVKRPAVPFAVETGTLPTGDYRVGPADDPSRCAIVERKSLADLYGTVARGRKRFVRELQRMIAYGYAAIVIEAEWSQILRPNAYLPHPTRFKPKSLVASLLAWTQRYGVHLFTCPGREAAEIITYRILERWHRDEHIAE